MGKTQKYSFLNSVYGKVGAAFFIGLLAIGLAGLVSKVGFKEMLQTVESLSAPNEKVRIINGLFYQVTQLEQLQHVNAIENPQKTSRNFEPEINKLTASIDSLREFCSGNPVQLARLDSMDHLLRERQSLSKNYFNLRNDLVKNQELSKQVNELSVFLTKLQLKDNNRVVTTQKKYITTTLVAPGKDKTAVAEPVATAKTNVPTKEKTSFMGRIFGSNKKDDKTEPVAKPEKIKKGTKQVTEEVHVKVDTYSTLRKSNSIAAVEKELRRIEKAYHERNAELLGRELALVKGSHKLNQQLLGILKTFEAEELSQVKGDYAKAASVVNASITRMNAITVIFLVGAAFFAFLIVLDISRGNKLQLALQKAKEEAEHLSQVKQRFLANMSHELRTPLQSILGFSEQVKNQKNPDPEALDAIFFSAEHLLQIVNEVLDYSRIISGKFTFEKKPFDVQKLAEEVVATLKPQATKKDLKLTIDFDCKNANYVSGDPFRLRQVLYNLLGNAIKFTDKGSVSLLVKCSQVNDRALFSFKVKDSGIGIPAKDIDRIFNQFEQSSGNDVQKHGGTGLGLSIAKTLIESQGGQLTVTSKYGEGSVFEIQVPYELAEKPGGLVYQDTKIAETAFEGEVLFVDDDAIILKLCSAILNKHHIKNTCLRSSIEAADTTWSKDLKVVFTDIQMPEMDGFALSKLLRARLGEDVKIYALTARALPEEHSEILAKGFDGILMKPFREEELLQVLNNVSGKKKELNITGFSEGFGAIGLICGNNEKAFQEMLQLFVTETRTDLKLLNRFIKVNYPAPALEVIHKLSGCVAQLGAVELGETLKSYEQALKAQTPLEQIMPDLKLTLKEVKKFVAFAETRSVSIKTSLNTGLPVIS